LLNLAVGDVFYFHWQQGKECMNETKKQPKPSTAIVDGIDFHQAYTTLVNAYARTVRKRLKRKRSQKGAHHEPLP
jgi:hypothetical protein